MSEVRKTVTDVQSVNFNAVPPDQRFPNAFSGIMEFNGKISVSAEFYPLAFKVKFLVYSDAGAFLFSSLIFIAVLFNLECGRI